MDNTNLNDNEGSLRNIKIERNGSDSCNRAEVN